MKKAQALSIDNVYLQLVAEMYRAYDWLNKKYAGGKMPQVVIAIASADGNKMGHFAHDIWQHGETKMHEIFLDAKSLSKGVYETFDTLGHEFAHARNFVKHKKVVDVADNKRHNLKFKEMAEDTGLLVYLQKQHGWADTTISPALRAAIDSEFKPNLELFKLYRKHFNDMKKRKDKDKSKQLTPVMIAQDTKALIAATSTAMGMNQKEFTTSAVKSYAAMPKRIKAAAITLYGNTMSVAEIEKYLLGLLMEKPATKKGE